MRWKQFVRTPQEAARRACGISGKRALGCRCRPRQTIKTEACTAVLSWNMRAIWNRCGTCRSCSRDGSRPSSLLVLPSATDPGVFLLALPAILSPRSRLGGLVAACFPFPFLLLYHFSLYLYLPVSLFAFLTRPSINRSGLVDSIMQHFGC